MTEILGVIPARYNSKRFPGKALFKIKGKPLIQWVYERSLRSRLITRLIVATDDPRIAEAAEKFNAEVFISRKKHGCGTERVAEVASRLKYPIVVNIQGDEISISAGLIRMAVNALKENNKAWAGTVTFKIKNENDFKNIDLVKVVVDNARRALYFSRSPIPFSVENKSENTDRYGHIGVYAFRRKYLQEFAGLRQGPLEKMEKLEQLRILENGGIIAVAVIDSETVSINRPEDIRNFERILKLQDK